jgi:hypothetical protein
MSPRHAATWCPTLPDNSNRDPKYLPDTSRPNASRKFALRPDTLPRDMSPRHVLTRRFPKIHDASQHFITRHAAPTRGNLVPEASRQFEPRPEMSPRHVGTRRFPTLRNASRHFGAKKRKLKCVWSSLVTAQESSQISSKCGF